MQCIIFTAFIYINFTQTCFSQRYFSATSLLLYVVNVFVIKHETKKTHILVLPSCGDHYDSKSYIENPIPSNYPLIVYYYLILFPISKWFITNAENLLLQSPYA